MSVSMQLSEKQIKEFRDRGFLLLPEFYDMAAEIEPIQRAIHGIVGLVIKQHGLPIRQEAFSPDQFDSGYQQLIASDRKLGGVVYDAVKQVPAFIRLLGSKKHEELMRCLRGSSISGVAHGSFGIRIDNPDEDRFNTLWHQDYPSHLRSPDGIVLWATLVPITPEMGPVMLRAGSHREGLIKLKLRDDALADTGHNYQELAKNFVVPGEEELLRRYPSAAPISQPGDLLLIDYLTLHRSGANVSNRSRWSMQFRYFNFEHPVGMNYHWCGSIASGIDFRTIIPEIMAS